MNFYLRVLNPAIAFLVFALCFWASTEDGHLLGFLKGGLATYFFAKGLFCAAALVLLGKIALGLFADERRAAESRSTRTQIVVSLAIFGFVAGSLAGLLLLTSSSVKKPSEAPLVKNPAGLEIVEPYELRETHNYTIGGTIKNRDSHAWTDVHIMVDVMLDGKLAASCERVHFVAIEPGNEERFLDECKTLPNERLKGRVEYQLRVWAAKQRAAPKS